MIQSNGLRVNILLGKLSMSGNFPFLKVYNVLRPLFRVSSVNILNKTHELGYGK